MLLKQFSQFYLLKKFKQSVKSPSQIVFLFRLQDALDQKTTKTKVMTVTQTLVDGKVVSSNTETKEV